MRTEKELINDNQIAIREIGKEVKFIAAKIREIEANLTWCKSNIEMITSP